MSCGNSCWCGHCIYRRVEQEAKNTAALFGVHRLSRQIPIPVGSRDGAAVHRSCRAGGQTNRRIVQSVIDPLVLTYAAAHRNQTMS